jgi:xylan 1,4-beta-xylosidase
MSLAANLRSVRVAHRPDLQGCTMLTNNEINHMRTTPLLMILACFLAGSLSGCRSASPPQQESSTTYCNPLDLNYRFALDEPSRREAADPTVVVYKEDYYLFASKSGGYWHSEDLSEWSLIRTGDLPLEDYAPTAAVIGDTLYFMASSHEQNTLYKTTDPKSGRWEVAREKMEVAAWDPAFFQDDDGRLYLYWGCSNEMPIYGVELDYEQNFALKGEPVELIHAAPGQHGWEVPGDYNTLVHQAPWIEGAWMNKHDGTYYLQYSGPGTEFKSYSDGVYVASDPLGPFRLQDHNPFAIKPEGFAAGAGHGSTFTDKYGNYWHIGTVTISQKHMFERRLALYPAFFDDQGTLHSTTKFGDYPVELPQEKISGFEEIFPGWMLLSYDKEVTVSSAIDSLPPANMTDEDIRTYWAAEGGNNGEFVIMDLGSACDVYALQVNFAEHTAKRYGHNPGAKHRYTIEVSGDREEWKMLVDSSESSSDHTHAYFQLPEKANGRYLKITNIEVPGGSFAISGFRVFGKGSGEVPGSIARLEAARDAEDKRKVHLSWTRAEGATGYVISYGPDAGRLYNDYQVYGDTTLTINSLNAALDYWFSITSFNENGIREQEDLVVKAR